MTEQEKFQNLWQRVRVGDEEAAVELVREFEPEVRRVVRHNLQGRLRRLFDSADLCQSVLGTFFVRAAAGQYKLKSADDLMRLLGTMARNRVHHKARDQQAGRRDIRRVEPVGEGILAGVADNNPTPSGVLAAREMLEKFREALSPENHRVLDLRTEGHSWEEIAKQCGGSAESLRKRYRRDLEVALAKLGITGESHA